MSLYARLFKYRGRQHRSPLEDFLTEALADLLIRLPHQQQVAMVEWLLGQPDAARRWRDYLSGKRLKWETQVYVPNGIADIVLHVDGNPALVIENKTWSAVRDHGSEAEPATQLSTYAKWLAETKRKHSPTALILLSATTPAPGGFLEKSGYPVDDTAVATWGGLSRWLHNQIAENKIFEPCGKALATDLLAFLKEYDLSSEILTTSDIAKINVFLPSYDRISGTFDLIWSSSESVASTFLKPTRSKLNFGSDDGLISQWRLGLNDVTPSQSWVSLGLRFPELVREPWGKLLPEQPHYTIIVGSDRGSLPEPAEGTLPDGWSWEDGKFLHGIAVHEFPVDPGKHADALTRWSTQALGNAKALLLAAVQQGSA